MPENSKVHFIPPKPPKREKRVGGTNGDEDKWGRINFVTFKTE